MKIIFIKCTEIGPTIATFPCWKDSYSPKFSLFSLLQIKSFTYFKIAIDVKFWQNLD